MPNKLLESVSNIQTAHARARRMIRKAAQNPELRDMLKEKAALEARIAELEPIAKLYEETKEKPKAQAEKIAAISEQLEIAEQTAADLRTQNLAISQNLESSQINLETAQKAASKLHAEIAELNAEIASFKVRIAELETGQLKAADLREELEAARAEIAELNTLRNAKALYEENKDLRAQLAKTQVTSVSPEIALDEEPEIDLDPDQI